MPIPWRSSVDVFTRILRQHAIEPESARDVDAAWDAFGEFLQVEVEGIERLENDGDGFIVEWGRWGWNDDQPSMSFGRLLAVTGADDRDAPERQPEYWKVELQLVFGEDPGMGSARQPRASGHRVRLRRDRHAQDCRAGRDAPVHRVLPPAGGHVASRAHSQQPDPGASGLRLVPQ